MICRDMPDKVFPMLCGMDGHRTDATLRSHAWEAAVLPLNYTRARRKCSAVVGPVRRTGP